MFSISPTRFTDIKSRRRGSVLTLAALSMVALLGFAALAVDYGQLVVTRNHLQRACDAAALAGAAELPASTTSRMDMATYQAQNTAFQNKVLTSETTVTYPTPAPAANSNRIRVSATRNVPTLFARVLGITSNTVSTQAVAGRSALKGIPGNIPLAITVDDYNKFKDGTPFNERLIDNNRQDFTPDTITAVDLRLGGQGKSGAVFEEDLKYGYTGTTVIGDPVNSALNASLASQSQKLDSAITYRITESAKAPWYDTGSTYTYPNYPPTNPRIVTIIVADPSPANNNNPSLTIRFFAPVYLETINLGSLGTFVRMRILPRREFSSSDPRIVLDDNPNADTTIGVIRLLS